MNGPFNIVKCETAQDFIDNLRLSNQRWSSITYNEWVFRGQNDVAHSLLPTIYRPTFDNNALKKQHEFDLHAFLPFLLRSRDKSFDWETARKDVAFDGLVHANIERRLLREFAWKANELGLSVPELEKALLPVSDLLDDITGVMDALTPNREFSFERAHEKFFQTQRQPALYAGLAQHHGIPTRLLDFTFNPLKAAFFATRNHDGRKDICVFALRTGIFQHPKFEKSKSHFTNDQGFLSTYSMMLMPNAVNDYLYRQEGLFLFPRFPHEFRSINKRYPSVEDYIRYRYPRHPGIKDFTKIILIAKEVPSLNKILRSEGISLARLMPTFDNVALEMQLDAKSPKGQTES